MANGRGNQLMKQIGEYLVASELARRGFLVATFSGNVPDFDLIATDFKGSSCLIQVKTIKGGSWQFSIDKFAEITFEGDAQRIGKKKPLPIPELICVFVLTADHYGKDQFFVLEWAQVQETLMRNHKRWLDLHGGKRPRKPTSMHCSIFPKDLQEFKDNWSIINSKL